MTRRTLPGALLLTALAATMVSSQSQNRPVRPLAQAFLTSLTPEQTIQVQFSFTDQERQNWNFVPLRRKGITLAELNNDQKDKLETLLLASLSEKGHQKVKNVESLEAVLYDLEGQNRTRDANLYTVTFFGIPDAEKTWAWRYEGHHLSLNFTFQGDRLVASTPQFFGANPETVPSGPRKGFRALPEEKDRAYAFLALLTADQKSKAIIAPNAPPDIFTGNQRQAELQERRGLPYADLTAPQKEALLNLVRTHAEAQTPAETQRRLDRLNPETIVFAWMGSVEPGKPHYYRIQSETVIIEYDNIQNNANHIHAVWRDLTNDFAKDTLADHYHQHPHPHQN